MVEKITVYKDKAGRVYEDEGDANAADARIDLFRALDEHGVGRGGEWDADMIGNLLVLHAEEFAPLLGTIAYDGQGSKS